MGSRLVLPEFIESPDPLIYDSDNFICLDVETTNISKGAACEKGNRLILVNWYDSITDDHTESWDGEYAQQQLIDRILSADFIVAHNAKMELGWLKRCGLPLEKVVVFDTMIAEYVLFGNTRPHGLGLAELAPLYGMGHKDAYFEKAVKAGVCPSEMPTYTVSRRCHKDVQQTIGIFRKQRDKLREAGLYNTFYTHCLLTPVLADIESNGMHLDADMTLQEFNEAVDTMRRVESELNVITGGINLRSPKQKQQFLYETLKFQPLKDRSGKELFGTDADTIKLLKVKTKAQQLFIDKIGEFNGVAALISKNLRFFHGVCTERGNIFYAQFNQTVTRSHRLSSSGIPQTFKDNKTASSVQFQNMPRSLKRLFCSRHHEEGWCIGEIDGSQLEFRVAAFLGQDGNAIESIKNAEDVHSFTSKVLTEAGQPTDRQDAKPHTFKPLYGGQSGTKAEVAYYKAFRQKYPGITGEQERWKNEVLKTKKLKLPTGLIFYWPDTVMDRNGYIKNSTNICNYPVQYFATGEIIPIGLVYLWHTMKAMGMKSFIVNTIHDSIIAEVHPDERDLYVRAGQYCMTHRAYVYLDKVYGIKFNVPLGTGAKVSRNWAATKDEIKYESEPLYGFGS